VQDKLYAINNAAKDNLNMYSVYIPALLLCTARRMILLKKLEFKRVIHFVVPENIHAPHGWFFNFYPHPIGISLPEGHLWTPLPPRNFQFFWRGFFCKLTAFLSLNKSENTSFLITQPLLMICCTHYNNISKDYAVFTRDKIVTTF